MSTTGVNNRNKNKPNGRLSKYRNVTWCKTTNKWKTAISFNNKKYNIGRYNTEEEAALAYNNFIIENKIEGAILNEIPI